MLDKIAKVVERYEEIERKMADPEVLADYQKIAELAQERSEMEPIVQSYHEYLTLSEELEGARELLDPDGDEEMNAMASGKYQDYQVIGLDAVRRPITRTIEWF